MNVFLKTQRLQLRNLCREDARTIFAYRNDSRCSRYQRWEDTSMAAVCALAEKHREDVFLSEQEEQHYAIAAESGGIAGDLTVFHTAGDCLTFGITVAPEYQRRGFAREILTAVVAAARERYPKLDLVALIDPENAASIALFESLGFYRECYAPSIDSCVYQIDGRK